WSYEKIKFKRNENIATYTRCKTYFEELVCRIYFGQMPAQAKIKNVEYVDDGGKINSIVKVTNSGESELTLGENSLKVLKKIGEEWVDTKNTYPIKEINLLTPNQEHSFVWEIELMSGGEYKLDFKFEGTNAGHDTDGFDLVVGKNTDCKRDESRIELQDYNTTTMRVINFCRGCKFGYECLAKWLEKNDGNNYDVYQTNSVQYLREMFDNEKCDRELNEEIGYYSVQGNCIPRYDILPTSSLEKGVCCIKGVEAVPNPCEVEPESTKCVVDWLPQNPEYVCPIEIDVSAYSNGCNANEWFNTSGTIE
ncbi:MAG: hypothetical protein HN878_01600, partial [Candidatus Diapherotrites archaeon]|nr:hypothetical protein [Candidatus Diapherotrites archaeon]